MATDAHIVGMLRARTPVCVSADVVALARFEIVCLLAHVRQWFSYCMGA